ncbi:MAG: DUF6688 family protein [bacterium]
MNTFQMTGLVVGIILILIALVVFALWWRPVVCNALTPDDATNIRRRRRLAYALVLLPTVCFALSLATRLPLPDWQGGHLSDYCLVAINARSSGYFLPLILYSMACALCLLRDPARYATSTWVRIGIVGGVVLTLQFAVIYFTLALPALSQLIRHPHMRDLKGIIPVVAWFGLTGMATAWAVASRGKWLRRFLAVIAIAITVAVVTLCVAEPRSLTSMRQAAGTILFMCGILLIAVVLIFAPFWCLAIFVHLLIVHLRRTPMIGRNRTALAGAGIWTTAYTFSMYEAVAKGVALYKSLPSSPPSCFVISAAANGHPCFVRATICRAADGTAFSVNHQLRYFKAFEIALAATSPSAHKGVRLIYNRAGPWMAALIRHPIAADLAYVSMKPAEWVIRCVFRIFLPASSRVIETLWSEQHIYTASHSSALQKRRRYVRGDVRWKRRSYAAAHDASTHVIQRTKTVGR